MSILSTSRLDLKSSPKPKVVRFQLDYNLKSLLLDFVTEKDRNLYEELLCQIRTVGQEIRDDDLTQLLKEARGCISILDTNFRLFVQLVLILRWAHRSDEVVDEYKGFLQELCSAHNYYTKQVIDHLVTYFKYDHEVWKDSKPSDGSIKCFNNIHHAIKSILSLIPMSKEILSSSFKKNYPYMKRPTHEHETYIYNLLQVCNYLPSIRVDVFNILISNLIILDSHAPRLEIESQMEVDQAESSEDIFELETCEDTKSASDLAHPIAHTLDSALTLIFQYVRDNCYPDGSTLDWDKTKSLYLDVAKIFDTVILPTHAIHHVQFLIFYLIGFKPPLATSFLQRLWKNVTNPSEAPYIRQASVFYIASLISRAKYISVSVVQEILIEMSKWTQSYIAGQEDNLYFDFRLHCVFYTICQAMFYVIAFRYKELVQGKGLVLLQGLNLSKIVTSRLNPLKACFAEVTTHFASVARLYQLAYCYSIMEHNARTTLPQVRRDNAGIVTLMQESQLDAFFPFDPYLLPRSYHFIEPFYVEYTSTVEGDVSVPSQTEEDSDDDFLETTCHPPLSASSPVFNYGTSPGFLQKHMH